MSRAIVANAPVLKFLQNTKPGYRKAVLKAADKHLIHCICECIHNTLIGKVPLTKIQKEKLTQHKKVLRRIVKNKSSVGQKKKLIIQKGGAFLPLLLAPIISGVLGGLLNK